MKQRIVLGITGGIASGKTTVSDLLAKFGIPVISSDALAHDAIRKNSRVYKRIVKRYGRHLLGNGGEIRRSELGRIVFRDAVERRWLEKQIHPIVVRELERFIRRHHGLIALDIPLLFEAKLQKLVDYVVVAFTSRAEQIRRLTKRNALSRSEALRRINAQMPLSRKLQWADIVLDNSGSKARLGEQIRKKILTLKCGRV